MESIWGVYGEFMESLWGVYGEFMGSIWGVYGEYMGSKKASAASRYPAEDFAQIR
jgi:hypothetical protein